jgi:membrane protein
VRLGIKHAQLSPEGATGSPAPGPPGPGRTTASAGDGDVAHGPAATHRRRALAAGPPRPASARGPGGSSAAAAPAAGESWGRVGFPPGQAPRGRSAASGEAAPARGARGARGEADGVPEGGRDGHGVREGAPAALWDFGRAIVARVGRDDVGAYAAALTYNLLFAVFPLGLALAGLLTWLHLPVLEQALLRLLGGLLAPEVTSLIAHTVLGRAGAASPALVYGGMVGYLLGMSAAFRSLIDAVNHAYEYRRDLRPFWKTYALSLGLAVGLAAALVAAGAVALLLQRGVGGAALRLLGRGAARAAVLGLRWLMLPALGLMAVAVVFWLVPDRPRPFAWLSPGSVVAVATWLVGTWGLSAYLARFNSYNRIYGSFGAAILLLLYLYLLSFALLVGAEVNAELERRR